MLIVAGVFKIFVSALGRSSSSDKWRQLSNAFWTHFFVDFVVSVGLYLVYIYFFLLKSIWFILTFTALSGSILLVVTKLPQEGSDLDESSMNIQETSLSKQVVRLSVSCFRTLVLCIGGVMIMGIDLGSFPTCFAKTNRFGITMMDMGVAYFSICHSLKAFRHVDVSYPAFFKG